MITVASDDTTLTVHEFDAPALRDRPEVNRLLVDLGFGPMLEDDIRSPFGRNEIWSGRTAHGTAVFVKRIVGAEPDVRARVRRCGDFERLLRLNDHTRFGDDLTVPRFLGAREDDGLLVYEAIADHVPGSHAMAGETFSAATAFAAGRAIAAIHSLERPAGFTMDVSSPALPSAELSTALTVDHFERISHGELQAWRLMHSDRTLTDAVAALLDATRAAPQTSCHCDFRVDQLLVAPDGSVVVTDFEEFRLADGARDVGSFAGEWLYRSVLDIVTTRGDDVVEDRHLDHDAVLRRGIEKIVRLRPRVEEFAAGYRSARTTAEDPDFHVRATAFAGWHMIDRLLAGSAHRAALSGIERAAAGIGRTVLTDPRRFAPVVGLAAAV
ncbi:class V lanthionine synthetase subunit LxmK [Rhodococcoides corynebacterioides]|uniref:class V lanthionine synthetase subunit LxmK n=1 Tax=Rhodococcoides corynebacterioides TaxID=53972 RepID=UPI001C9A3D87|nr:class V lanthionine synthetase subunit LxmK [Rhodococcus corynebacterioides]MBY6350950.1 phosphotransferase [Rhodococcus corynebacterioides]